MDVISQSVGQSTPFPLSDQGNPNSRVWEGAKEGKKENPPVCYRSICYPGPSFHISVRENFRFVRDGVVGDEDLLGCKTP